MFYELADALIDLVNSVNDTLAYYWRQAGGYIKLATGGKSLHDHGVHLFLAWRLMRMTPRAQEMLADMLDDLQRDRAAVTGDK